MSRTGSTPFQLVVGFPFVNEKNATALLSDLYRFRRGACLRAIVLCGENGYFRAISPWLERLRSQGIKVHHVSDSVIRSAAERGEFGEYYVSRERQTGIAFFRTALHHYLYLESLQFPTPVVWVLDDDVRLPGTLFRRRKASNRFTDLVSNLKSEGVDIAVGRISGDPPIPGASMIRAQLLDLDFNLRALRNPEFKIDIRAQLRQNRRNAEKYQDFYYDLSRSHSGHLETPWFYISETGASDRATLLDEMLERISQIEFGANVFRPLPDMQSTPGEPTLAGREDNFRRGGNTLVLGISCLRDYPNISPRLGEVTLRRGDTMWTILNKRMHRTDKPYRVARADFSLRQDREYSHSSIFDSRTLLADIEGAAFTLSVNETLRKRNGNLSARDHYEERWFTDDEISEIIDAFTRHLKDRFSQLRLNSWRITGLVTSIRGQIHEMSGSGEAEAAIIARHSSQTERLLASIEEAFAPYAVDRLRTQALSYSHAEVGKFLRNLGTYCTSYRGQLPSRESLAETENVISFLRTHFGNRKFKLLAKGGEAFLFTDGKLVYKYFYKGLRNFYPGQLEFIQKACSSDRLHVRHAKYVLPIERAVIDGSEVAFASRFLPGHTYTGGNLGDIIGLLQECRRLGIVLTNISPGNLLSSGDTLSYVDIGRSVEQFDENAYRQMCKRAFLVYRWHFRSDIKELLTSSISNDSIPELFGFEQFLAALKERDTHEILDDTLLDEVAAQAGRLSRVLDYGCGNGGVADKLAQWGVEVSAFDIDRSRYDTHWHPHNVRFIDQIELKRFLESGSVFDIVTCNLVLCSIGNIGTVAQILSNLRRLADSHGRVIVTICNPFDYETRETEIQVKRIPARARYADHFECCKSMKTTDASRADFHRPVSWYKMMMKRAGLEVCRLTEVPGTDTRQLTPGSDFIVFTLKPAEVPESSDVSLLIKASAMEWRTIEKQVSHLVNQLEGPRLFREKLVVIDEYEGPFAREYDSANLGVLKRALKSMVQKGLVSRVLVAPPSGKETRRLARKWFSLDSRATRCENGQPTMTTLYGIENCAGEYVLHVDSDCLIGRQDRDYDYLHDALELFERDPQCLTVSFPIASRTPHGYTFRGKEGKRRTEVRFGIVSKPRLETTLPLPNQVDREGLLVYPWHRALDLKLRESSFQSYRGTDPRFFFIHVPNVFKRDFNSWYNIMKAVEEGRLYKGQVGHIDLVGRAEDWLPRRREGCVLVVRGRDVPVSKLRRCLHSLFRQTDQDWGVIFIDAGSQNGSEEYLEEVARRIFGQRMSYYRNLVPEPPIANIDLAVRQLCANEQSIIIMPDADDAFMTPDAIADVKLAYSRGADLAIGGLLRTDKEVDYPADFHNPRGNRGGNVWQPLKTFRKYLFDRIDIKDLKIDDEWVPHTEDWAFMLPMAEMAKNPVQFQHVFYLYEPSALKQTLPKREREHLIASIVRKRSYGGSSA